MSLHDREWPNDTLPYMTKGIITTAKNFRNKTGVPMKPSPLKEAHVRFTDSGSRHAVGIMGTSRKADATDIYILDDSQAAHCWVAGLSTPEIGGFGIYFDTILGGKPQMMFHLDRRSKKTLWLCPSRDREREKREYINFNAQNPSVFLAMLSKEFDLLRQR